MTLMPTSWIFCLLPLGWSKDKLYSCANKLGYIMAKKLNSVGKPSNPFQLRKHGSDPTSDLGPFITINYPKLPTTLSDEARKIFQ